MNIKKKNFKKNLLFEISVVLKSLVLSFKYRSPCFTFSNDLLLQDRFTEKNKTNNNEEIDIWKFRKPISVDYFYSSQFLYFIHLKEA